MTPTRLPCLPPEKGGKMTGEVVIRTINLSKRYGRSAAPAVRRASIEITRGEIYGLVGGNGAGKTTLLRMLMGMVFPTEGSVEIFGAGDAASLAAAGVIVSDYP
jgi:ABC-2 type transport system ATP-binding protein